MIKNISKFALIILLIAITISCMAIPPSNRYSLLKTQGEKYSSYTRFKTTTNTKAEPILIEKKQPEKLVNKGKIKNHKSINNVAISKDNSNSTLTKFFDKQSSIEHTYREIEASTKSEESIGSIKEKTQEIQDSSKKQIDKHTQKLFSRYKLVRISLIMSIIIFGLIFLSIKIIMYIKIKR